MAVDYVASTRSMHEGRDMLRDCWPDVIWRDPKKKSSRLAQIEEVQQIRPKVNWGTKDPRWTTDRIDVLRTTWERTPSMIASGTTASVVGFHFDWLILDDLVYDENVQTPELREKTLRYFQNCMALLRRGGRVLVIGTRWHYDDLYATLLDENGPYAGMVDSLVLDCGYSRGEPIYPVNPRVPKCGFDMERLEMKRQSMSDRHFWAQYMNEPRMSDAASFREKDINRYRMTVDGEFPGAEDRVFNFYTALDPNHSQNSSNDPGVVITIAIDDQGDVWVVEITRGHPTIRGMVDWVFDHYARWKSNAVVVESAGFQLQLEPEIRRQMDERDCSFRLIASKRGGRTRKMDRILKLQPLVERRKLHVPVGELGDELVRELIHLGSYKNDDIADALTDAFSEAKAPNSIDRGRSSRIIQPSFTGHSVLQEVLAGGSGTSRLARHRRV